MRNTEQRRVILEELVKVVSHPTAVEIYEMVRKRLPRVSLGTIYRNLEILAQNGTIQKLEVAGTQKRFDGNATRHYHVRCLSCGRVDDVPVPPIAAINDAAGEATNYDVLWHHVEFEGICPRCQKGREKVAQPGGAEVRSNANEGAVRLSTEV